QHTLAERGSKKLWDLINTEDYVNSLGALTGNQAVQQVKAGLKAIYLSGWQVAADANQAGETYPDQSLYPANSVPQVVRRINKELKLEDKVEYSEGMLTTDYSVPIVENAEEGFVEHLTFLKLRNSLFEAAVFGLNFEDN